MLWILSPEYLQVLIAGLLGNLIRFLYISFITWPWLVLPFEFLQGKKLMVLPSPSFEFLQGPLLYICFIITSTGELLYDDNYDDMKI